MNVRKKERMIYQDIVETPIGNLYLGADETGLIYVDTKLLFNQDSLRDKKITQTYVDQLSQYLKGTRQIFTCPISQHITGTSFQKLVWQQLALVPYGEIWNYSDLAQQINQSNAVRAVANAVGKNPLLIIWPCHRIIRKDGQLGGFRSGANWKYYLQELEKKGGSN